MKKRQTKKTSTSKKNKIIKNKHLKKFQEKIKKGSIGEKILALIMLGLISITLIIVIFFIYIIISAPNFTEDGLYASDASIIYYANGDEMARVGSKNREKVSYDDIPEVFIDALLATEDSRFLEHSGIDMARFLKASIGQVLGNSSAGGGSTLTMQVVKQTFTDDIASGIKGIIRKFTDIYMAVFKIEKKYTKEQIIEFYVNIPYLGSGTYGIEQAAQTYFGKTIGEVSLPEAATLAGLFQAPDAFDPYISPEKAEARRNQVLTLMKRHHYITDEEWEIAKNISVESLLVNIDSVAMDNQGMIDTVIREVKQRTNQDPHLVAMKIYSTFMKEKQEVINKINNGTDYNWPNDVIQTGIAVIDVDTGGISAIGAGRNKKSKLGFNYATQSDRHPGSTSKPMFDFGPAIEYLNWGTGQMIIDDVHGYSGGGSVRNWDGGYKGIMTIKTALAASRNTTALQAFQATPNKKINEFVTGLNLNPEYDANNFLHEAHSIGAYNGESPLTTAAAYATFARGGIYIEPHSFTKIEFVDTGDIYTVTPEKRTVMKDSTAYLINMILRYAVTGGHISAGSKSGTDVASKTGTSSLDRSVIRNLKLSGDAIGDSWQVVYSPDYVCATWIGYPETTKEYYLRNSVGGTIRRAVSRLLTAGILEHNSRFKRPSSVVTATIELETNPLQLASEFTPASLKSTEYFRKGTAPSETSVRFAKLMNPTNLEIDQSGGGINLSWNGVSVPDAISTDYLTEYFNQGYGKWAKKYLNKRFAYNNSNIGSVGYQVYLNNNGSLTDLGWTSNTSFKYNGYVPPNASFIVKTSYSIFKANMSDGISVHATTNEVAWKVELNGSNCLNINEFNAMLNINQKFVTVTEDGLDVTNEATINTTCKDSSNNTINCSSLSNEYNYTVNHTILYKGTSKKITRDIKKTC
ncbi:MAG: transglycosylase domain-containing protein [Bacilli bacterium]|nr:transglycosylase domain-containing protein [Bacilli bacterium]